MQLDLVDTSRPAVDPASERNAPTHALPTELYLPATTEPRPLILFAHGYGGDPSKFTQLFGHWADAGFVMDGNPFGYQNVEQLAIQMPLLVYHADQDPALPFESAYQSYTAAGAPKWFITIFGALHAQPFEDSEAASDAMVMDTSTRFWRGTLLGDTRALDGLVPAGTVPDVSTAEAAKN